MLGSANSRYSFNLVLDYPPDLKEQTMLRAGEKDPQKLQEAGFNLLQPLLLILIIPLILLQFFLLLFVPLGVLENKILYCCCNGGIHITGEGRQLAEF